MDEETKEIFRDIARRVKVMEGIMIGYVVLAITAAVIWLLMSL